MTVKFMLLSRILKGFIKLLPKTKQLQTEKKSYSNTKLEIYKNIDELPYWNFQKIVETNDLSYLFIEKTDNTENNILLETWELILKQFIENFGVSEQLRNKLLKQKAIELLEIEMILTGNKSLQAIIDVEKKQLEKIEQEKSTNNTDFLLHLEYFFKFQIDTKKTSVKKIYEMINFVEKHNKNGMETR